MRHAYKKTFFNKEKETEKQACRKRPYAPGAIHIWRARNAFCDIKDLNWKRRAAKEKFLFLGGNLGLEVRKMSLTGRSSRATVKSSVSPDED